MSGPRPPMPPPVLAGYEHVRLLGSGGYSDVFLYEQQLPRRQVAIKVLLTGGLGDEGRQQFYDEANAMASVSTHPYIVTVLHADVSPEGHPFLVMEYYPHPNFSQRARNEQIPVAEVLRTGIQVASAVETAHRAGILHRDIKPANILTSEYNRPGLTDFGIATTTLGATAAEGLSIPWAPREVINAEGPPGVAADVYSLAATIYTLLAGRSPFEITGGSNRTLDLIQRIEKGNPPPTGRADVPASLERLLNHGMSRSAHDRPGSALELGRMLQAVEIEAGWATTHLEIREDTRDVRSRSEDPGEDGTRLKSPTVVHGQSPSAPTSTSTSSGLVTGVPSSVGPPNAAPPPPPGVQGVPDHTVASGVPGTASAAEGTVMRGAVGGAPITSGVGERPLGLSGAAPPRPVRPMPGATAGPESTSEPTMTPAGASGGGRPLFGRPSRAMAGGVLAVALAIVVVVLAALNRDTCDPATEDCGGGTTSSTVPTTLPKNAPESVPKPEIQELQATADGRLVVTWKHSVPDPSQFTYTVISNTGAQGFVQGGVTVTLNDPLSSCAVVKATDDETLAASDSEEVCLPPNETVITVGPSTTTVP